MKKTAAFILALLLCLSVCACGANEGEPIVGDDWRTWGLVRGSGTLVIGGEEKSLLFCVGNDSINAYLDEKEQKIAGSAQLPPSVAGVADACESITCRDTNGDGKPELVAIFVIAGERIKCIWYVEGSSFVLKEEETTAATEPPVPAE